MNIPLPETLKNCVDKQVIQRGYGTSSEYVHVLFRGNQDQQLLVKLLAGDISGPTTPVDGDYFDRLRERVLQGIHRHNAIKSKPVTPLEQTH